MWYEIILGFFAGIFAVIAIFMIAAPAFVSAGLFINHPTHVRSGVHFFTFIEQGEVKFVVRGDNVVRAIMNTSGKAFAKNSKDASATKEDEAYWELTAGTPENPTNYVWWPLRWWARYVYATTGAVFTGAYPFQRIREKQLERTIVERTEEVDADGQKNDNLRLRIKTDISDHFRLRRFLFYVHVIGAETKDKIPVDFLFVLECETSNPFKAAFGIDRWDNALTNFSTDQLTKKTLTLELDEILTAEDEKAAEELQKSIKKSSFPMKEIGIKICGVRFLKREPRVTPEELKTLRAEALALQQAKATKIDGKARADNLREINKANEEGGPAALATLEAETRVRTAAAAGAKGIVIIGSNTSQFDPIQLAQLQALQDQKEKGSEK